MQSAYKKMAIETHERITTALRILMVCGPDVAIGGNLPSLFNKTIYAVLSNYRSSP